MAKKQFRWKYFIDKPFQMRFIARFLILILVGLGISLTSLIIFKSQEYNKNLFYQIKNVSYDENGEALYDYDSPVTEVFNMAEGKTIFQISMMPMVWMSVLYLALIIIFGLFISHKLAGPVYRIKKTLLEVSEGKLTIKDAKFSLRKRDELKDLVEALNSFLEKTCK